MRADPGPPPEGRPVSRPVSGEGAAWPAAGREGTGGTRIGARGTDGAGRGGRSSPRRDRTRAGGRLPGPAGVLP